MKKGKVFYGMLLMAAMIASGLAFTQKAEAATFSVNSAEELQTALSTINAEKGSHTVNMGADITSSGLTISDGVKLTINGNGHTLNMNYRTHINVANGGELVLGDGENALNIIGTAYNDEPGLVYVQGANAVLTMNDMVSLSDNQTNNYYGGGVTVQGGTFNMHGGKIKDCGVKNGSVCYGGGVAVFAGGTFNMDGGSIEGCYAETTYSPSGAEVSGVGGGVFVTGGSTANITGGSIIGNSASGGGGGIMVCQSNKEVSSSSTIVYGQIKSALNINGDVLISGNTAPMGAGIAATGYYYTYRSGLAATNPASGAAMNPGITVNGATITGNTATGGEGIGGGLALIMLNEGLNVSLSNCEITDNESINGAGIYAEGLYHPTYGKGALVQMSGNTITGNTASGAGGGLYSYANSTDGEKIQVTGGVLANNIAGECGSDVYTENADLRLFDAGSMGVTYLGLPDDVTGKDITGWYEDTDALRYTAQTPEERTLYEGYASITDTASLIAAPLAIEEPEPDEPAEFEIKTDYFIKDGYTGAGDQYDPTDRLNETFTLTIEPVSSFNRELTADGTLKTDIPQFPSYNEETGKAVYEITTGDGTDKVSITLPDFTENGMGDYWYKVTTDVKDATGVTHDTNDYYIHVVVSYEDAAHNKPVVTQILMHKTAPEADGTFVNEEDDKSDSLDNKYASGSLTVTKEVKGNMGDKEKEFNVAIVLSAAGSSDECPVKSTITYTNNGSEGVVGGWTYADGLWSATVNVSLHHEESITFNNVPDSMTYTVKEADYSEDGYQVSYKHSDAEGSDSVSSDGASGSISDDADAVTIVNKKGATIDVGVTTDDMPYILMMLGAGVVALMLFTKKKRA